MKYLVPTAVLLWLCAPAFSAPSADPVNLALNKPVSASSTERDWLPATDAVDGSLSTRWSSDYIDNSWITVDLQARYRLTDIRLHWQNSYSKDYDIKVSADGEQWTTIESVEDSDGGLDELSVDARARYVRVEGYRRATRWGHSLWELEVFGHPEVNNVALGQPVTVSSVEVEKFAPHHAVDGNDRTRWSSNYDDHNWIVVDFGEPHQLTEMKLYWQNSYSRDYEIQTSYDGEQWTTIDRVEDSDGGLDQSFVSGHGRYLRVEGYRRATRWGHSLWELEAYGYASAEPDQYAGPNGPTAPEDGTGNEEEDGGSGSDDDTTDNTAPSLPGELAADTATATTVSLQWSDSSDEVGVFSYEVYRDGERIAEVMADQTEYRDTGLDVATDYEYRVRASDMAGNWSDYSQSIAVHTADMTAVSGPVTLEWRTPDQRENGDYLELDEIAGYEIRYRRDGDDQRRVVMVEDAYATEYELNLSEGHYQFEIAVYDRDGLYSDFSPIEPAL